jgi:hypothetical protein
VTSTEARAAAAAAAMCGAPGALACLGGAIGDEARALVSAWAVEDRAARARGIAHAAAAVRAPAPLGLPLVHREHIEAALAGEGARVRAVIAGAAAAPPAVRAYLERRVLGGFVAMPRGRGSPITPESLAAEPPDWLAAQLERAGLHQLAHAAAGEPRAAIAAIAAQLGARGARFVDAVARVAGAADAAAWFGPRRAAIARASGAALAHDPLAVHAIGARAFAPHLVGDAPRQLAQRLPRGLGLRVAAEVARASREGAPAWAELVSS